MRTKKLLTLLLAMIMVVSMFTTSVLASEMYTVKPGDVLWKIAEEFDITWEELAEYNNLGNPHLIMPDQKLEIPDGITITILGTSDMHGAINSWSYESGTDYGNVGLAKVASVYNTVKAENPNTLLIDNGDTIQGSILTDDLYNLDPDSNVPMIDVMSFVGYDAITLGNHEFNFGLDLIKKLKDEAKFAVLSANTYYKADGSNFATPYIIKEIEGVKVGILGLTVPSIPKWDGPKVTDLTFKHMADEAKKYVPMMKEEGADIIVVSAHSGLESRHETDGGDAARLIAEQVPEIDVLLTGHDHSNVSETINGVLVGAPAAKYGQSTEVVKFDLSVKEVNGAYEVTSKEVTFEQLADYEVAEDVLAYGDKYHQGTLDFLKNTIGTATADFVPESEVEGIPEAQIRDTALIDFINDVQLKYTGADVAAAALFKSSSNLAEGDLNYANVFDIYKYPNTLYAVEVTGKELKDYMEWSASYYNTYKPGDVTVSFNPEIRGYNYDMFAGVEYKVDISKPAGERIVDLTMKGAPVTDDQIIKLAVNNYRFGGLTSMEIISNKEYFNSDPKTLRAYIKDYIEELGTLTPVTDNNWEIIGADLSHPLRDEIIAKVNAGEIAIPTSEDGRTANVKALNVYELIEDGVIEMDNSLTIVHTNDTHARVDEGKYAGMGLAKVATIVKEQKEANDNVLVLDAGDTFHGQTIATLNKGESIVEIMNTIGYDAMAAGNHDFNYGQERLLELDVLTDFPILSANVKTDSGEDFLSPYIIKELDGFKVAIFGLSTPETVYMTHPDNVIGLTFEDPVTVAKNTVAELEGKADIIICLAHLGLDESSTVTSKMVAEQVSGIDVLVDGHSHSKLNNGLVVNDTLIVQTGDYDKNVGIVNISLIDGEVVYNGATLVTKDAAADTVEDPNVLAVIDEVKTANEIITSVVVGNTTIKLDGERADVRTSETNLGNLIADAMVNETGADFAFTNGGGIRASVEIGEITKGDVITVLPFGNYVVTKSIKGSDIVAAIEHGISDYPDAKGAFPHVSGLTFTFNPSMEAGSRVVEVKINGVLIDLDKNYTMATNDFLAAGGDGYDMFEAGIIVGEYPGLDEVLIDYINEYGTEGSQVDGRVTPVETTGFVELQPAA